MVNCLPTWNAGCNSDQDCCSGCKCNDNGMCKPIESGGTCTVNRPPLLSCTNKGEACKLSSEGKDPCCLIDGKPPLTCWNNICTICRRPGSKCSNSSNWIQCCDGTCPQSGYCPKRPKPSPPPTPSLPSPKPTQPCVPMFDGGALQCSTDKNAPEYQKCCQDHPEGKPIYCKKHWHEKQGKYINECVPEVQETCILKEHPFCSSEPDAPLHEKCCEGLKCCKSGGLIYSTGICRDDEWIKNHQDEIGAKYCN